MPENVAKEAMQNRTNGENEKEELVSFLVPFVSKTYIFFCNHDTKSHLGKMRSARKPLGQYAAGRECCCQKCCRSKIIQRYQ